MPQLFYHFINLKIWWLPKVLRNILNSFQSQLFPFLFPFWLLFLLNKCYISETSCLARLFDFSSSSVFDYNFLYSNKHCISGISWVQLHPSYSILFRFWVQFSLCALFRESVVQFNCLLSPSLLIAVFFIWTNAALRESVQFHLSYCRILGISCSLLPFLPTICFLWTNALSWQLASWFILSRGNNWFPKYGICSKHKKKIYKKGKILLLLLYSFQLKAWSPNHFKNG